MSLLSRFRRHHAADLIPAMRLSDLADLGPQPPLADDPEWSGGQIDLDTGQIAKPAPEPEPPLPAEQCCRRVGPGGSLHWFRCPVGIAEERAREWFPIDGAPGRPADRAGEAEVPARDPRPRAWADPINGLVETASRSGGVADGLPSWVEPARVTALGNAVVPAVGALIGRLIVEHAARELVITNG